MLSQPGAQAHCSPYSISTSFEPLSILQHSACDELSSSDKENSPSYSFQKPNRAKSNSPLVMGLLQSPPTKQQMSFTPQRGRPPLRAWERRPATPFVPRIEGQKIWKRVPLQELGVESNQQISRRDREERASYLRVVKRLRLDNEEHVGSNENCGGKVVVAMGTKWEEDTIETGGSPKKKKKRLEMKELHSWSKETGIDHEPHPVTRTNLNDDEAVRDTTTEEIKDQSIQPVDEIGVPAELEIPMQDVSDSHSKEESAKSLTEETTGSADNDENIPLLVQDDATTSTWEATVDMATKEGEATTTAEQAITPRQHVGACPAEADLVAKECTTTPNADVNVTTENFSFDSIHLHEEAGPTARPKQVDKGPLSENTSTILNNAQSTIVLLASDNDETAFLRDFLERAQASKAAKITLSPSRKTEPLSAFVETDQKIQEVAQNEDAEVVDEIEDDDLSPPIETDRMEQMFSAADTTVASPMRRSARTASRVANSRLPRFQIPPAPHFGPVVPSQQASTPLPGTIQLKRATGNEFIFNAKSQQTLAMVTRSNTKRNQGEGVRVAQRLAQLKKELEVREQEQLVGVTAVLPDTKSTTGATVELVGASKNKSRKRKHEKQDVGKPPQIRRNVQWPSDEELARYREPSPFLNRPASGDAYDESLLLLLPESQDEELEITSLAPTPIASQSPLPKVEAKTKKEDSVEESSKLKVRRTRRIKLDSVNGTPAPKTRSRSTPDSEPIPLNTTATLDGIVCSSSNTRKSSRVPVPIFTPIALPSFTSTKSKPKIIDKEKEKDDSKSITSATDSTSEPNAFGVINSRADTKATEATDFERRLDGRRRRLRGQG